MCLVTKTDFFKLSLYRPFDVRTFLESLGLLLDLQFRGVGVFFRPHFRNRCFIIEITSYYHTSYVRRNFWARMSDLRGATWAPRENAI